MKVGVAATLAAAMYPHGFTATVLAPNFGTYLDVNQVIAAELAKIGIRMQIKSIDVNAWNLPYPLGIRPAA